MSGFFSWLLGVLIKPMLDWAWMKIQEYQNLKRRQTEIDERTKKEADGIKNAETEDELEKAAKEILNRK